jgi:hypothetical protein
MPVSSTFQNLIFKRRDPKNITTENSEGLYALAPNQV